MYFQRDETMKRYIAIHIFNISIKIEAFAGHYFEIDMRLKLLMSFAYCYDYSVEIFVTCTVEGQVSRLDERYLLNNTSSLFVFHIF